MNNIKWLIWSNEHKAWWGHNHNGYTPYKDDAGRYTWEEAIEILDNSNRWNPNKPEETLVPDLPENNDHVLARL